MSFIKDPLVLLAECAAADLDTNTELSITESSLLRAYDSIEECTDEVQIGAKMVPVIKVDGVFVTEMNWLAPYMNANGITSIMEALNDIAMSNGLPEKSVGLLVESKDTVSGIISKVVVGAKKQKTMDKLGKNQSLLDKLKKAGYPVKRKKNKKSIHEDKTDIAKSYEKRIKDEKSSNKHNRINDNKKEDKRIKDTFNKKHFGQTDPSSRALLASNYGGHTNYKQDTKTKEVSDHWNSIDRKVNRDGNDAIERVRALHKDYKGSKCGLENSNDRKRAKKAEQNEKSTNESVLNYFNY